MCRENVCNHSLHGVECVHVCLLGSNALHFYCRFPQNAGNHLQVRTTLLPTQHTSESANVSYAHVEINKLLHMRELMAVNYVKSTAG